MILKGKIIILFILIKICFLLGCRVLQGTKFTNISRLHHIKKSGYIKDTLFFEKAIYYTVGVDRRIYFRDTYIEFDTLTRRIYNGIQSLSLPVKMDNVINRAKDRQIETDRIKYNYNTVSDKTVLAAAPIDSEKLFILPIIIRHSRIHTGDYGLQQTVDLYIKVCVIKNNKIIYSKFFMTFKNSKIFSFGDAMGYVSTRSFFEENGHTPSYTQEDWNNIMEFAMRDYIKRLRE